MFANADLGENVLADTDLGDCNLPCRDLTDSEHHRDCNLSQRIRTRGELRESDNKTQPQLPDSDDTGGSMANRENANGETADGNDSFRHNALACLWIDTTGVMHQR